MRQFDAYQNPSPEAREIAPYLVVLSSHHLRDFSEVVVAPAVNDATRIVSDLELPVEIQGEGTDAADQRVVQYHCDQLATAGGKPGRAR